MSTAFPPAHHAWERSLRIWDALTLVTVLATMGVIWFGDAPYARRLAAVSLLLTVLPLYVVLVRPVVRCGPQGGRRAVGYVVTAVTLFSVATWLAPASWGVAFTLIPHCYMLLPTRWAVCAVAALNLGPGVPTLLGDEDRGRDVAGLLAGTVMITTFSAVFGLWIDRIIQQSRERAELIEQLTASRAEVARLSREAGVAAERERLTGEIHDTLAQGFTSILMLLQGAEALLEPEHPARRPVGLAARTARENLAEARALVAALPPAPLEEAPLTEALRRLAERFGEVGGASSFEVEGPPRALAPSLDVVLLRAAQEALANVRKHAAARSVALRLSYGGDEVRLTVCDDGRGFDPAAVTTGPDGGFGLAGLRQRVEQIGGTVDIASAPGAGTTVAVRLTCS
ncbi:Histidine kinase-, DNA gyrase B-, and HSP90-like ATPase [Thermomonospora echinospora]|uniref:Oxygen sensor histidine kinase NreB n=1 Tax=Thermomonospora echinospora TaxID=1992 RepID=A0A1H5VW63_9ACTN|nr:sensor histidine kinase [Thermomonospora echinospora]SEF91450.1 Histidine kinase-, DNA gyrase B-, and HSP90-like ATPase [Thermomonospora echinospora]